MKPTRKCLQLHTQSYYLHLIHVRRHTAVSSASLLAVIARRRVTACGRVGVPLRSHQNRRLSLPVLLRFRIGLCLKRTSICPYDCVPKFRSIRIRVLRREHPAASLYSWRSQTRDSLGTHHYLKANSFAASPPAETFKPLLPCETHHSRNSCLGQRLATG